MVSDPPRLSRGGISAEAQRLHSHWPEASGGSSERSGRRVLSWKAPMAGRATKVFVYAGWFVTAALAVWGWSLWIGPRKEQFPKSLGMGVSFVVVVEGALAVIWFLVKQRSQTRFTRRHSRAAAIFAAVTAALMFIALHWWDYQRSQEARRRAGDFPPIPSDARNGIRPEVD